MSKRFLITALTVAVLLAVQPVTAQPDALAQVEKKIVAAWGNLNGVLASVSLQLEIPAGEVILPATLTGRLEYMKGGTSGLFRNELNGQLSLPLEGVDASMPANLLTVFDGRKAHTLSTILFEKMVVEFEPPEKELGPAASALFKALHENCTVRLLPDATVKGIPAYVIEGTVKEIPQGDPTAPAKFTLCFAKDSGVLLGVVAANAAGRGVGRLDLTNIKLNPSLNPSRFRFVTPSDARVIESDGASLSDFLPALPGM